MSDRAHPEATPVQSEERLDHSKLSEERHREISGFINRLGGYDAVFRALSRAVWMEASGGKAISPMNFADAMLAASPTPEPQHPEGLREAAQRLAAVAKSPFVEIGEVYGIEWTPDPGTKLREDLRTILAALSPHVRGEV